MRKGRLSSRTFHLGKCTTEKESRDYKCNGKGELGTIVHCFSQLKNYGHLRTLLGNRLKNHIKGKTLNMTFYVAHLKDLGWFLAPKMSAQKF